MREETKLKRVLKNFDPGGNTIQSSTRCDMSMIMCAYGSFNSTWENKSNDE